MAYLDGRLWPQWYTPRGRAAAGTLIRLTCQRFHLPREEVLGRCRARQFIGPRVVIARILRERGHSYAMVGRLMGGRDHTSIIHYCENFDVHARLNPMVNIVYRELRHA